MKKLNQVVLLIVLTSCLSVSVVGCQSLSNEPMEYTVTQHGCWYGPQMSFYTITDNTGGLIVIDGGLSDNADEVREVIYAHGNHVDAWFITHPHIDHVGAFNVIWDDLRDITIDVVFAVDMPSNEEIVESAHWDTDHYAYDRFRSLDTPVKDMLK
jgi:glyoxylase-like metal-dependent hydrolase (beta-lactamase superfamily II)